MINGNIKQAVWCGSQTTAYLVLLTDTGHIYRMRIDGSELTQIYPGVAP